MGKIDGLALLANGKVELSLFGVLDCMLRAHLDLMMLNDYNSCSHAILCARNQPISAVPWHLKYNCGF